MYLSVHLACLYVCLSVSLSICLSASVYMWTFATSFTWNSGIAVRLNSNSCWNHSSCDCSMNYNGQYITRNHDQREWKMRWLCSCFCFSPISFSFRLLYPSLLSQKRTAGWSGSFKESLHLHNITLRTFSILLSLVRHDLWRDISNGIEGFFKQKETSGEKKSICINIINS